MMFRRSALMCAAMTSRAVVAVGRHSSVKPVVSKGVTGHSIIRSLHTTRTLACSTSDTCFNLYDYDEFQEKVLHSETPVLVDFYASWCGPCKMLTPRLESIVDSRGGQVLLAKANVDECDFALDYDVQAVPTVIAFKDGQPIAKFMGMKTDDEINAFLDEVCES